MNKVLVVDDEKLIVKGIKFALEHDGMSIDCAYDGEKALEMAKKCEYDVVLLDIMLPKMDGLEVCRSIREFSNMPIIMLTAKDGDMDKILGFEYGADDYITKPFNILEVKARIKAMFRRSKAPLSPGKSNLIHAGEITLDVDLKLAYFEGNELRLTAKEYELLELFVLNPGKVFSREQLLNSIWGYDYPGFDVRTVDVHIRRLRAKIEKDDKNPVYINTKWGVGYYFKSN